MEKGNYRITDESMLNLSLEVLKFYYDNALKRLSDFHQQAKDTTERGYKLIAIYVSLLTLECAYLYTNWQTNAACMAILAMLIGTVLATGCMLAVILPRLYIPLGRDLTELQPNEYANSFGDSTKKEMQQKCILRDELGIMQGSINIQEKLNARRTRLFSLSLIAILIGVISSAIVFLLVKTSVGEY